MFFKSTAGTLGHSQLSERMLTILVKQIKQIKQIKQEKIVSSMQLILDFHNSIL